MKKFEITFLNEFTINISFFQNPSDILLTQLIFLKNILISSNLPFLEFVNVAYNSISIVFFQSSSFNLKIIQDNVYEIINENFNDEIPTIGTGFQKKIEIPTNYIGEDLEHVSKSLNISILEVIRLHTEPIYTVAMVGFLPGFPYLMGLNPKLQMPRKNTPSLNVKKGSVAIAGAQTGIYPVDSPGGWQIIGKTDIELFDEKNSINPSLLVSGDRVKFIAI